MHVRNFYPPPPPPHTWPKDRDAQKPPVSPLRCVESLSGVLVTRCTCSVLFQPSSLFNFSTPSPPHPQHQPFQSSIVRLDADSVKKKNFFKHVTSSCLLAIDKAAVAARRMTNVQGGGFYVVRIRAGHLRNF